MTHQAKEGGHQQQPRSLDDTKILGTIVTQPIHFKKWAIFCLEKDVEHGEYLNDKFYQLSEERRFDIYVDYGDIVELSNKSGIEAFKEAKEDQGPLLLLDHHARLDQARAPLHRTQEQD